MVKIKCKNCGEVVVTGDIGEDKKGRKVLRINSKCQGEIWKNGSRNPEDWMGVCSKCQPKLTNVKE